ncbi:MAG TPA: hypothetical protein VIF81_05000 [Pyrinomonadaceae bacterium]|jgi:hypothetical protein
MNTVPLDEPTRVTIRRIVLGPYVKWYTLAFAVLGVTSSALCTAWYMLDGQLHGGKAIVYYFLAVILYYAVPGLIGSILFAVIYNLVAARVGGGLQFDIVVRTPATLPTPPPPPEHWEGTLPKINAPDQPGRA